MIHTLIVIWLRKWSPRKNRDLKPKPTAREYIFLVLPPDEMKIILIRNSRVQYFKLANDPIFQVAMKPEFLNLVESGFISDNSFYKMTIVFVLLCLDK